MLICGDGVVRSIDTWDVMCGRNAVLTVAEGGTFSGFDEMGRGKVVFFCFPADELDSV